MATLDKTSSGWTRSTVAKMHKRYEDGATLRELGDENDITYERVRQLFNEFGFNTKKQHRRLTLTSYQQKYNAWERQEEILELYKEFGTVEAVADHIGLSRQAVAPVLSGMERRQMYRRRGESPTYDIEYIKKSLQNAAKVAGEPLTIPGYRKIAPKMGLPADLTVIKAFGSWQAACDEAGVKVNPAEGPRRGSITPEQCIESIKECATELGRIPSYDKYSKWARANKKPSGPTVRVKIGPWSEALLLAFGED